MYYGNHVAPDTQVIHEGEPGIELPIPLDDGEYLVSVDWTAEPSPEEVAEFQNWCREQEAIAVLKPKLEALAARLEARAEEARERTRFHGQAAGQPDPFLHGRDHGEAAANAEAARELRELLADVEKGA